MLSLFFNKPSVFPTNWASIQGKPATFPTDWSMINNRPTTLQQMGINITANFYVATGIARDGDWLPIPNGFQEHQCHFFISPRDLWDYKSLKMDGFKCYLEGRQVIVDIERQRDKRWLVNYLVIAIK